MRKQLKVALVLFSVEAPFVLDPPLFIVNRGSFLVMFKSCRNEAFLIGSHVTSFQYPPTRIHIFDDAESV
jgi:hypothetical protein